MFLLGRRGFESFADMQDWLSQSDPNCVLPVWTDDADQGPN